MNSYIVRQTFFGLGEIGEVECDSKEEAEEVASEMRDRTAAIVCTMRLPENDYDYYDDGSVSDSEREAWADARELTQDDSEKYSEEAAEYIADVSVVIE